ncbi:MAG: hypothetical protein P1U57_03365 [Oleibacter sp.]|nr:hypothetical protein [Thalassolituus sp.]
MTKANTSTALSAADWESVLNFRAFPILPGSKAVLRNELKKSTVSFASLSLLVERDPALCWHLQQAAMTISGTSPSNAQQCLATIGMSDLIKCVKDLPQLQPVSNNSETNSATARYQEALFTAHMSGCLAAQWAAAKGQTNIADAHWSAMLMHSLIWPWLLLHPHSHNWLYHIAHGRDLMTAAKRVFGVNSENWQRLGRRHHLPEDIQTLLTPDRWPTSRDLKTLRRNDPRKIDGQKALLHASKRPEWTTLTAATTAWHLHIAPESSCSERWQSISSHVQGRPLNVIQSDCRQVQIEQAHLRHSGFAGGLALLASPEPIHLDYEEVPIKAVPDVVQSPEPIADNKDARSASVAGIPAAQIPLPNLSNKEVAIEKREKKYSEPSNAVYLSRILEQLRQEPASFGEWNYLMQGMLKGVSKGIGIECACVALTNQTRDSLRIFYEENSFTETSFTGIKWPMNDVPLLQHLMEKSAALQLPSERVSTYLRGLPETLLEHIGRHVVIMSIHAGGRPIGIVIAFNKSSKKAITESQYQSFKELCGVTSKGLTALKRMRQVAHAKHFTSTPLDTSASTVTPIHSRA